MEPLNTNFIIKTQLNIICKVMLNGGASFAPVTKVRNQTPVVLIIKTPGIVKNLPLCMQGRQNPHKTKDKRDTSRKVLDQNLLEMLRIQKCREY